MPTLQVITLGCSKNTVDTEHLLYQVRNSYEIVPEEEVRPVDVQLINTWRAKSAGSMCSAACPSAIRKTCRT